MSLGGGGPALSGQTCATTTDGQRAAVCAAASAGITVVVAAGNENANLMTSSPALYPEVLTVTAMGDSDGRLGGSSLLCAALRALARCSRGCSAPAAGQPARRAAPRPLMTGARARAAGGSGPALPCRSSMADGSAADFSNYAAPSDTVAQAHTVAAPGVCINSTVPGGGYDATYSGTSMATPHVAGVVALCYGNGGVPGPCAGKTPAQVGVGVGVWVLRRQRGPAALTGGHSAAPAAAGGGADPAAVRPRPQVITHIRTVAQQRTANNQGSNGASITSAAVAAGSCNTAGLAALAATFTDDGSTRVTLPFAFTYQGGRRRRSSSHAAAGGGSGACAAAAERSTRLRGRPARGAAPAPRRLRLPTPGNNTLLAPAANSPQARTTATTPTAAST
jgi:subtilisin family serine protease